MGKNSNYIDCTVTFNCSLCGRDISIRVHEADYMAYSRDGESSKDAFPYLTPNERKILDLEICEDCLNNFNKKYNL